LELLQGFGTRIVCRQRIDARARLLLHQAVFPLQQRKYRIGMIVNPLRWRRLPALRVLIE
jgi:hypothetical protein